MKRCSRCGQEKEDGDFYPSKTLKSGLRSACKNCENGAERNLLKDRANNKKWFQENKTKRRDYENRRKYNVSADDIEFIFGSQGRCCGICGADEPKGKYNAWHIDHDHKKKKVRGILCGQCNWMLGHARDRIDVLQNAIKYLGGRNNVIPE